MVARVKVAIIGYSGCGKSTLAKIIAEKYSLPIQHLDKVHWLPGWNEREFEDEYKIAKDFLDNNDSWVIDGNYTRLERNRRLEEADWIIFMNFNRFVCFSRILKRHKTYKNVQRDSITEGCPERLNLDYLEWALFKGRTWRAKANYSRVANRHPEKFLEIKNQKELDEFIASLDAKLVKA